MLQGTDEAPSRRICFLFVAQQHQILHGISVAAALARRPGLDVSVVSTSADHIAYARMLVQKLGGAPVHFHVPRSRLLSAAQRCTGRSMPPKRATLAQLSHWLNRFDAIALPERTSIALKSIGVSRPFFIHLDHGAGDRAISFDPRIREFDFALVPGEKHRARLLRDGLIRRDAYAVIGYPKFDAADAVRCKAWRPFEDDDRPVVLYNPHFGKLGSWDKFASRILEAFAAQDRYNLVVAPHIRLLDEPGAKARWQRMLQRHAGNPHILMDAGSSRCVDMTYTTHADIYLGDVSSQVYEFIRTPRPCLFLNAHAVDWRDNEDYAHWHLGAVTEDPDAVIAAIDLARATHAEYRDRQVQAFARTFDMQEVTSSERAATAIVDYLRSERAVSAQRGREEQQGRGLIRRAARWGSKLAFVLGARRSPAVSR